MFTLFVFGALTYITVKRGGGGGDGSDPLSGRHVAGNLTHRLMSDPLDSDDENQSEMTSTSVLEIEGHHHQGGGGGYRQHSNHHNPMDQMAVSHAPREPYRAPEPQQYAPINNEWTE